MQWKLLRFKLFHKQTFYSTSTGLSLAKWVFFLHEKLWENSSLLLSHKSHKWFHYDNTFFESEDKTCLTRCENFLFLFSTLRYMRWRKKHGSTCSWFGSAEKAARKRKAENLWVFSLPSFLLLFSHYHHIHKRSECFSVFFFF